MKILISTACAAMFASTAMAADPTYTMEEPGRSISGYGEVYVGGIWVDAFGDDDSAWAYGGAGQVNVPFADRWNAQGGLTVDAFSDSGDSLYALGGELHVFWRDPSSFALGGFVDGATYEFSADGPDESIEDWRFGPEAQIYFDRVTLYGQAYYGQVNFGGAPVDFDQMGVRAVARYFATDNLRFDAEIGFHQVSIDEVDVDFNTFSLGLQAMYRFSGTPLSAFGRYQFDTTSFDAPLVPIGDDDFTSHKFVVGLRASFGTETLLEEDRNGATMDTWRSNLLVPLF